MKVVVFPHEVALVIDPVPQAHEYAMLPASSPVNINVTVWFDTLAEAHVSVGATVCRVKFIVPVVRLFALSLITT